MRPVIWKGRMRTFRFLLDIAYASAVLYRALRQVQPEAVELRIVDGDHEWDVWQSQIAEGLRYINKYISRPELGD